MFLQSLVSQRISEKKYSIRKASREIGIAHTTLDAFLKGETIDLKTIQTICTWLNVSVRDALGFDMDSDVASAVASVLESEPALLKVFLEAAEGVRSGELSTDDLEDIIRYAVFRINARKARSMG